MKLKNTLLHFLLLCSPALHAKDDPNQFDQYLEDQDKTKSLRNILDNKATTLNNESIIKEENDGVTTLGRYSGNDKNRLSLAGLVNDSLTNISTHTGAELLYARRMDFAFLVFYGSYLQTEFANISGNKDTANTLNGTDEKMLLRPDNSKATLIIGGAGVGYRFKTSVNFFSDLPESDFFHTVDAIATFNVLKDAWTNESFTGPGLQMSYGVHYRIGQNFYLGPKFHYNLATVERAAVGNELNNSKRLNLAWLSFALEIGQYF